jgi:hypothetical protein
MNWIKENKFLAALGGGTLLGVIVLFLVGSHGAGNYTEQKEKFGAAADEAKGYESSALYPKTENKNQKEKALSDYRQSTESLQSAFVPFRPTEIKNISPQEFTDHLLQAEKDTKKAFEDAGTIVPEAYFVGFERYKTSLADGKTTGILDYQLNSIKNLLLELAKAKPTELRNLHRPLLPEDEGQAFVAPDTMVARPFPLEITFTGTEKAARQFVSSIVKAENQFLVIRSLRVTNAKKDPPKASDAQFEKPAAAKEEAGAEPFAGGFVLPGEEPAPADAAPAEAPKAADGSRILAQVLGTEQLNVFLRIDLLQFLPAKKLP